MNTMRSVALLMAIAAMGWGTAGCAVSGSIIDQSRFETPLTKMKLVDYPALKVLHNGVVRQVSLKKLSTLKINAGQSVMHERELFLGADLTLKDGTTMGRSSKSRGDCFVSVQNTLWGKNDGDAVTVGLERITRINVR